MTPVFQTIIDPGHGNCLQAALATLLDKKLEDVPNFIEFGSDWFDNLYTFVRQNNCDFLGTMYNPRMLGHWGEDRFSKLQQYSGVNGYFVATVLSATYFKPEQFITDKVIQHAVVIDSNLQIVHDPNPNNVDVFDYPLTEQLDYHGITAIYLINKQ